MGCATSLVKFILFLFNFIIVVGGVCLVAFGAMAFSGYNMYAEFVKTGPYLAPPIGMMVIGSVIVLIAFMGCCGVLRESKCMMMSYATVLAILLVLEVGIAVYIYKFQDELKLKETFEKAMLQSIPKYGENEDITKTWDTIQSKLQCCGVENYKDWQSNGKPIPQSCCKVAGENCVPSNLASILEITAELSIYTKGCIDKAVADMKTDEGMYAAIAVAGVELLGIIFGCCLGARFGRKRYSV